MFISEDINLQKYNTTETSVFCDTLKKCCRVNTCFSLQQKKYISDIRKIPSNINKKCIVCSWKKKTFDDNPKRFVKPQKKLASPDPYLRFQVINLHIFNYFFHTHLLFVSHHAPSTQLHGIPFLSQSSSEKQFLDKQCIKRHSMFL